MAWPPNTTAEFPAELRDLEARHEARIAAFHHELAEERRALLERFGLEPVTPASIAAALAFVPDAARRTAEGVAASAAMGGALRGSTSDLARVYDSVGLVMQQRVASGQPNTPYR